MNALRLLLSLALFGLLAACVTGGVAMTDFDARADFSQYHSFAFHEPLGTNRDDSDTLLSQRLKAATARQMQARGFVYDEREPDLLVDFHARVEEHVYPNPGFAPYGYYGYGRRGFYPGPGWGWGLGMSFGDDYDTYRQGRLNIDLIDAGQHKLVWESVVNTNAVRSTGPRAEAMVDAAVATAFRRFPVMMPAVAPATH